MLWIPAPIHVTFCLYVFTRVQYPAIEDVASPLKSLIMAGARELELNVT